MTKKVILGAVASIALSLAAGSAFAQDLGVTGGTPITGQTVSGDTRTAMVVRSSWGGYRPARQGDNDVGIARIEDFVAAGQTPEQFDRAVIETQSACRQTGEWVRESIAIIGAAGEIDAEYQGLATELARLGDAQNRTSWIRRGFSLLSTGLLCTLSGGLYCGAAASSAVGGEINSSQHDRAMRLNRRQSELNVDQARLQLRATILTMRMNIGWAGMIQGYCLQTQPDVTLGS